MFQLGMGMHAIMDSHSPFHQGFQVWNGLGAWREALEHSRGERKIAENDPSVLAAIDDVDDYYRLYGYIFQLSRISSTDPRVLAIAYLSGYQSW